MDNIVESAKYNGVSLAITSDDLTSWKKMKTIEFKSCYDSSPGKLQIKGRDLEEGIFFLSHRSKFESLYN